MEIVIGGASGLIGQALTSAVRASGHRAVTLVRRSAAPGADEIGWDPAAATIDASSLEGFDAAVHLGGAGIGDRRWTDARKRVIWDSRIDSTRLLATTLAGLERPPSVFVCGSAIGYYGSRGDERLTESASAGTGFLAELVTAWEAATEPASAAGIRVPLARTGLVLAAHGGTLAKLAPIFKLGLGGRFGPGSQWLSWITLDDEVRAIEHLLTGNLDGPVNRLLQTR